MLSRAHGNHACDPGGTRWGPDRSVRHAQLQGQQAGARPERRKIRCAPAPATTPPCQHTGLCPMPSRAANGCPGAAIEYGKPPVAHGTASAVPSLGRISLMANSARMAHGMWHTVDAAAAHASSTAVRHCSTLHHRHTHPIQQRSLCLDALPQRATFGAVKAPSHFTSHTHSKRGTVTT